MICGSGGNFDKCMDRIFIGIFSMLHYSKTFCEIKLWKFPPLPEIEPVVHGWSSHIVFLRFSPRPKSFEACRATKLPGRPLVDLLSDRGPQRAVAQGQRPLLRTVAALPALVGRGRPRAALLWGNVRRRTDFLHGHLWLVCWISTALVYELDHTFSSLPNLHILLLPNHLGTCR